MSSGGEPREKRGDVDGTPERLESWKEIGAYLKRSSRTVQRWERTAGLPVRRLVPDKRGSVYAVRSEVDAWRAARTVQPQPEAAPPAPPHWIRRAWTKLRIFAARRERYRTAL
jgi:hypothetical protein